MAFPSRQFAPVFAAAAVVGATTQTIAWAASRRAGRVNVVDVAWGPGLAGIAAVSAVVGTSDRLRRGVLATAVTAWGVRLAAHVHRNGRGRGEDPRYVSMLAGAGPIDRARKVFLTQGAAQWLVSLPIQAGAVAPKPRGRLGQIPAVVGVGLMIAGAVTEAVADRQKAAWRKQPDRGSVMDHGLWSYSRHPNYLGDAGFWWGVYVTASSRQTAWWTIISPIAMTWLLTVGTGAKPAEKLRAGDPDYAEYQRRVSFFLPRPPKDR